MTVKKYSSNTEKITVSIFTLLTAIAFIGLLQWQCLRTYEENKVLEYWIYQSIQIVLFISTIVVLLLAMRAYTH